MRNRSAQMFGKENVLHTRNYGPMLLMAAVIGWAAPQIASAHHSFAMCDMGKEIQLTGVVKAFEYTNPHSWTRVLVTDDKGVTVEWSFEGFGPGTLQRYGWNRTTIKAGDKITVFSHPLRNGEPGGTFERAILPDGRVVHQIDLLPGNPSFKPENIEEQKRYAESEAKRLAKPK